jgi:hypothetical protein
LLQPQGNAEVDALNALAPKYYCPEFDDWAKTQLDFEGKKGLINGKTFSDIC